LADLTGHSSEFDNASAIRCRQNDESTFDTEFNADWLNLGIVNGGVVLAVVGRALRERLSQPSGHQDPFAISAHYLAATVPGPAEVRTEVIRRGRSLSTAQAGVWQVNSTGVLTERVRVLGTYGDLDSLGEEFNTTAACPDLIAPQDCISTEGASPEMLSVSGIHRRIDLRLDPTTLGRLGGDGASSSGVSQGWLRLRDGRKPDPLMLLLASDVLPPVTFNLGMQGAPATVHLSVYVRAKPASGWLRLRLRTSNVVGHYVEEDAEIWDSAGRLVLQARHLIQVSTWVGTPPIDGSSAKESGK
jgi:acyl-coenzyme A thioesterase PaaI-like protein